MKKVIFISLAVSLLPLMGGCKEKKQETTQKEVSTKNLDVVLYNKTLPEIKEYINGKWELVSGQNARELNEFEKTFIEFKGDNYVWTEDGNSEKGKLNWRKESTGAGYDAYLMDVFYAEYPSYPVAVKGDTLYIQDCTETAYRYKLVRR